MCKIPQLANRLSSMIHTIQAWAYRMSIEDQKKLLHVFRFGSHPKEFIDVMVELRDRYDFIPEEMVESP